MQKTGTKTSVRVCERGSEGEGEGEGDAVEEG